MLSKVLKNIRAKPESVRRGITLSVSLGITAVIGFFWFVSYINYSAAALAAKPPIESPTNFLNKMGSLIGDSYANVRSKIGSLNTEASTSTAASDDPAVVASSTIENEMQSSDAAPVASESAAPSPASGATARPAGSESGSVDLQDILNTEN